MSYGLLDQLETLVLVISIEHESLLFANQSAHSYFKEEHDYLLTIGNSFHDIFKDVYLSKLIKKIERGRDSHFIVESKEKPGIGRPIKFKLKKLDEQKLMCEGFDYSDVKETEHMLKSYSEMIEKKNRLLKKEQRRVERLLFNTLPEKCVTQLRQYGRTKPECFSNVSVLFLDFVGFTKLSQKMSTENLFRELNEIFTTFDTIISEHRCERIKTIGDAYLAVCGMPDRVEQHANLITSAAHKMRRYIKARNQHVKHQWQCRIGIHTGEVTGGVVGRLKYIYDIFGDGVNTASRMETYSEVMQINISRSTKDLLAKEYVLKERGLIEVKGKGKMEMFFLEDIIGAPCENLLVQPKRLLSAEDSIDDEILINFTPFQYPLDILDQDTKLSEEEQKKDKT